MADLDQLGRTALVPHWARVRDALMDEPVLGDSAAVAIAPLVANRFGVMQVSDATRIGCCLRNRLVDEWIGELLRAAGSDGLTVVDIGVGLDTRLWRLPLPVRRYVEVDREPIIQLRDRWLPDTGATRLSADGMCVHEWDHAIEPRASSRVLLILEGVLAYQDPARVSAFFASAAELLAGGFVLFDSVSPISSWLANRPAARASGRPRYTWSPWRARSVRAGELRLRIIREKGFMDLPRGLTSSFSTMSRIVHAIPPMRRTYRITLAQLPDQG
jgi:O-methyltransferase involved in polyketide biosynthesis